MPYTQTGARARAEFHGPYNDISGHQINYFGMLDFLLSCLALTICTSASHRYRRTAETCVWSCLRLRPSSKINMLRRYPCWSGQRNRWLGWQSRRSPFMLARRPGWIWKIHDSSYCSQPVESFQASCRLFLLLPKWGRSEQRRSVGPYTLIPAHFLYAGD